VLYADATLSSQNSVSLPGLDNFTMVQGGYPKPHRAPHLKGIVPLGGNVGMLDGHAEWRKFEVMIPRTVNGPYFWW